MKNIKKSLFSKSFLLFLVVTVAFMLSCNTKEKQDSKEGKLAGFPEFSAETHRGGRGVMPENTIPAMLYSLSLDYVTTLEMDIHVTADNQLAVTHDAYLNPLFILKPDGTEIEESEKNDYAVFQMTYDEIKEFDVGSKVHPNYPGQKKMKVSMPLLDDVIDAVQDYIKEHGRAQVFYNIETKSSEAKDGVLNAVPEDFVKLLMDVIEKKGIAPYTVIQSFDPRTLRILNEEYPHIITSYLVGPSRGKKFEIDIEKHIEDLGFVPDILSPHYKYVTEENLKACHDKGVKVVVYTPNTKEEIVQLKEMGIDGIITDYPELLAD